MRTSILVADDEVGVRDMLAWELGSHGHEVVVAGDGNQAIDSVRREEFDLVISDVRMPGSNGLDVLRVTKEVAPDTEVIVATGYAELEYAIDCVRHGAFAFIQKPFQAAELLSTVERALERRQLRTSTALYEACHAIFASLEPEHLPQTIVKVARKVMLADDVSLMLLGADDRLYVAYADGLDPHLQDEVRIAMGERVAGRVAEKRTPVLISSGLEQDPKFADIASFGRVRSSIVYPLAIATRLLGVLNINRLQEGGRPFRQRDLDRASVLASQTVLALENVRLTREAISSERLAAVGQLAAGVAHEIRNPVAYVMANQRYAREQVQRIAAVASLLENGAPATELRSAWDEIGGLGLFEEMSRALGDAEEGTTRIRDIARDLGALARRDDGPPCIVDLNEVVRSALRLSRAEVHHRASVVSRPGQQAEVLGHANRLCQIFVNLLVNAAQAIGDRPDKPGEIVVATRRDGDDVVTEVRDNGPGIPPAVVTRIFEPLFTTKGSSGGTGLGLSISREIADAHGGRILVDSRCGEGTVFRLILPAADGETVVAAQRETASAPPP